MAHNTQELPHSDLPPSREKEESAPLAQHMTELRRRLIICVLAFFAATCACYFFAAEIYAFLVRPLADAAPEAGRRMIYTGLAEAFIAYLKLSLFAGFILSFPVFATQLYRFLAPGMYQRERKTFVPYLIAAPVMFLAGAAFAYYLIFPAAWQFFLGFESAGAVGGLPIQLEAKVSDYLSLSMHLILAFGLSFQLPVVLVLLVKSGLISVESLKKGRRYAIVAIVAIAAVVTPPDVFSQIALSVPMYLLYEVSILLCRNKEKPCTT